MAPMRVPRLVWQRKHNVAALTVSFGGRIWETREAGDLILGYNAAGRLAKVVILDARSLLGPQATMVEALERVIAVLLRAGEVRQAELDVLSSALERARSLEAQPAR